jgi:hypothetical protein
LTLARSLQAQAPAPERDHAPAIVSWGKWGATALFVGMTVVGISRHDDANRDYRALVRWCQTAGSCLLVPDGTYADPLSESLYQSSIAGDRAARRWLIAGQVALAGAVALFITQLTYEHGPENIPFEPRLEVAPGPGGTHIGLRLILPH